MPKSYDDPGEGDPVDLARMAREAKERAAEKAARRSHPGFEQSTPPPRQEWPPKPLEGGGGYSSPPPPPRSYRPTWRDRHARGWGTTKEIGGGIMFVGGIVVAVVLWVNSRASKEDIASLTHRMDPVCLPPESDGKKPLPPSLTERLDDLKSSIKAVDSKVSDPQNLLNKRLDRLDEILMSMHGSNTKTPAPPVFGPTAKAKGRP